MYSPETLTTLDTQDTRGRQQKLNTHTQRRKLKLSNTNLTTTLEMNPDDRQYICPIFNNSLALQWKLFAQPFLPYSNE
jgi:hypothetical protein